MSIEAMKQALEIIKNMRSGYGDDYHTGKEWTAINALRQAIEQAEKQKKLCKYCGGIGRVVCDCRCMPEQEPVAWSGDCVLGHCGSPDGCDRSGCCRADLAPPKREWVGLTDEEIHKIIDDCTPDEAELEELNDFAKAIFAVEAKLKERNT